MGAHWGLDALALLKNFSPGLETNWLGAPLGGAPPLGGACHPGQYLIACPLCGPTFHQRGPCIPRRTLPNGLDGSGHAAMTTKSNWNR